MGIDARMFVRVRGQENWLSEERVKRLAYEIASCFDPGTFFTVNPVSDEYGLGPIRALEILTPVSGDEPYFDASDAEHIGRVVWTQDGPAIVAEPDEQFIRVGVRDRYYGEGYERGSWSSLRAIIAWLNERIRAGEVWYGGDSSGVCAERADADFVAAMDRHWIEHGHRPYTSFSLSFKGTTPPECPLCGPRLDSVGGGPQYDFYRCAACGQEASVHVSGTIAWAGPGKAAPAFDASGNVLERSR